MEHAVGWCRFHNAHTCMSSSDDKHSDTHSVLMTGLFAGIWPVGSAPDHIDRFVPNSFALACILVGLCARIKAGIGYRCFEASCVRNRVTEFPIHTAYANNRCLPVGLLKYRCIISVAAWCWSHVLACISCSETQPLGTWKENRESLCRYVSVRSSAIWWNFTHCLVSRSNPNVQWCRGWPGS